MHAVTVRDSGRRWLYAVFARAVRGLFGTRVAAAIWKVPGSRSLYDRLAGMRPDTVTIDGHVLRLDPTDSLLLAVNGEYETAEIGLFAQCIRPGDVVFDIGAHIGLYTLAAARAVGPSGRVVSFEPSGVNYGLLEANVAANGYQDRVDLHHAAVSDRAGAGVLALSATNSGDHQLRIGGDGEKVSTVRLDDLLARPQVVKMDVQGAEPLVLSGAHGLLEAEDLLLFTEVSPHHLGADGARAYVTDLRHAGFELLLIDEATGDVIPFREVPDAGFVNLLCVKGTLGSRVTRPG